MSQSIKVIGLMSGTSLDGLDMAYCEFWQLGRQWHFAIKAAQTAEYPAEWTEKLQRLPHMSGLKLVQSDLKLGRWMGEQVREFTENNQLEPDFVASHGHTVFHQPEAGLTWQIGNGHQLRASSGLPVIADFRSWDVALGGQGAPLVPIGDKLLFGGYALCLNIGGIANISAEVGDKRLAYDICGANMVLNHFARKQGKAYDHNGEMAARGQIDSSLLEKLGQLDFYQQAPPKSLGYEWIYEKVIPLMENSGLSTEDLLCTYCHHAGAVIAREARKLLEPSASKENKMLVTGGGAYNDALIECIKKYSENRFSVEIPDPLTINYKEALIFAFLGVLKAKNQTNVLKEVTGASQNNSGGLIYGFIPKIIL
jgi:anhydro-N-acetylmuramic acid kinase